MGATDSPLVVATATSTTTSTAAPVAVAATETVSAGCVTTDAALTVTVATLSVPGAPEDMVTVPLTATHTSTQVQNQTVTFSEVAPTLCGRRGRVIKEKTGVRVLDVYYSPTIGQCAKICQHSHHNCRCFISHQDSGLCETIEHYCNEAMVIDKTSEDVFYDKNCPAWTFGAAEDKDRSQD